MICSSNTPSHLNIPIPPPEVPPISAKNPIVSSPPAQGTPRFHNEALQEFANLQPKLMITQEIIHKSINQVFLEHHQLLQMIPFMVAAHLNEMHRKFCVELNSLLGNTLEEITGINSKFLQK
ncbi:hypothetical protein O181_012681 [Austropuccinia psidii MF-1]|uniref:Uncharacterized protein n=1 Tax=Austropuccinia psidii MF-1 TaxID=1389203 RepID=A0A9Q3BV13_9BASI|nr:hypothetical protein [Austropuccinia psidii MF-1]